MKNIYNDTRKYESYFEEKNFDRHTKIAAWAFIALMVGTAITLLIK